MQAIDGVLEQATGAGRIPGAVAALSSSAGTRYLSAFGMAAAEAGLPMQADTVFRIASMTKLVTSVALMGLVDDGLVDLDAPLSCYVDGFVQPEVLSRYDAEAGIFETRPAEREATLRELLSHTGGYGYWWLHEPLRLASGDAPNLIHPPFLMAEPGSGFAYSTSTDVIGLLFEPVTGVALDRFLEQRLFAPLGMPDTGFRWPDDPSRLARVHRRAGTGFSELEPENQDNAVQGGTGLFSTAADYTRLLRCLLRGGELDGVRVLSEHAVREITSNQIGEFEAQMQRTALATRSNDFIFMDGSQKFGFGVMIETRQQAGKRSVGSFGWGGIVNTYFWVDPARDLACVLMMQMVPFACPPCMQVLDQFELAVYESI